MNKLERNSRKTFRGMVVSDKMNKTRVVIVERTVKDGLYAKVVRRESRFYAHDEGNESHSGDMVEMAGIRPLSKLKRWRITRIIAKSQQ